MSVKELRALLRKCNADQNCGELTDRFRDWIIENEQAYKKEIQTIVKLGDHHVSLVYYSIIYTILKHTGCYFIGKNSDPIEISHSKYCQFLNLDQKLSKNARKTIANDFYGYNYLLSAASRANGERIVGDYPSLRGLESICIIIYHDLIKEFLV